VGGTTCGLGAKNNPISKRSVVLKPQEKRARVHFIPDLKVGVFVTLRAPEVIKEGREWKI
jgi:hypothetical protein